MCQASEGSLRGLSVVSRSSARSVDCLELLAFAPARSCAASASQGPAATTGSVTKLVSQIFPRVMTTAAQSASASDERAPRIGAASWGEEEGGTRADNDAEGDARRECGQRGSGVRHGSAGRCSADAGPRAPNSCRANGF